MACHSSPQSRSNSVCASTPAADRWTCSSSIARSHRRRIDITALGARDWDSGPGVGRSMNSDGRSPEIRSSISQCVSRERGAPAAQVSWHNRPMDLVFEQIRAGGDRNFGYLLGDRNAREAVLIDPSYSPEVFV